MIEDVNKNNVLQIDISELALDKRFGSLVFENANKKLTNVQKWLKESQDLMSEDILIRQDFDYLRMSLKRLVEHLEWIHQFSLENVTNAKQQSDEFNRRIDDFYNDFYTQVPMRILPFLREERRRENPGEQKLDEELKQAVQIRTELEEVKNKWSDELQSVREETEAIRATSKEVGAAKVERGAVKMASHFDGEVERYEKLSKAWLIAVVIGYTALVGTLIWLWKEATRNFSALYVESESGTVAASVSGADSVIWVSLVSKLVILAALWYGLSFIIKNYNVNSHLSSVNRHRGAVARTIEDFIAVEDPQGNQNIPLVLQNATEAMFKNIPVGYVSKTEKETSNPVLQIVNDLMGIRNGH